MSKYVGLLIRISTLGLVKSHDMYLNVNYVVFNSLSKKSSSSLFVSDKSYDYVRLVCLALLGIKCILYL